MSSNFKSLSRIYSLALVLAASAVFCGCDQINSLINPKKPAAKAPAAAIAQPAIKGTVIGKVNNLPITLEELNQEVNNYNNMVPADKPEAKITTRQQKVDFLKNEMVRRSLLYQEASSRGMEKNEEIVRALNKAKMDLLVVDLVRTEAGKVDVSSKEIEDFYNKYKERYKDPEERQLRQIVVPNEQDAKDIYIQLLQGGDFATLAKDRSKDKSAKDGGDLGFVQKGKNGAQFDSVAFSDALEVGKISNIFKGDDGYCILKLEGRRGGKQKSLNELWDDIKTGLTYLKQQQKIDELIAKLQQEAKIEIYEGEIK